MLGRSRRTSKFSAAGRELRRTGLIDDPGALTETGEWVAAHLRDGRHMVVAADSSPPQLLTLWIGDMTVLAISHLTDAATGNITHRIVHCLADDIPRLVFMWLELQPSWDMTFEITCSQAEFIAKLQTGAPPGTVPDGDATDSHGGAGWRCRSSDRMTTRMRRRSPGRWPDPGGSPCSWRARMRTGWS